MEKKNATEKQSPRRIESCPRLLITASSGGGGKTLLSLGLCRALRTLGYTVKAFKKGPDYIDAAWLSLASSIYATNLDPFFLPDASLRDLFVSAMSRCARPSFALIEGNRGLYDGLDVEGSASSAHLAHALNCPLVISLDCTKMTRTSVAVLQGLCKFDPSLKFMGVILNKVGTERQAKLLLKVMAEYSSLPVYGVVPRLKKNPLPERHMGIASHGFQLAEDAERRIEALGLFVAENVNVDTLAQDATNYAKQYPLIVPAPSASPSHTGEKSVRIGYVYDSALWFYYQENLDALSDAGAKLEALSLFDRDIRHWENLDGLYLGGGFPEDMAEELSRMPALSLLYSLALRGLPIYAECGGFMLLASALLKDGKRYSMANVFPVDVEISPKPQGLGYTEGIILQKTPFFPVGMRLRGHEFHYSRCLFSAKVNFVLELERGRGMGSLEGRFYDGLVRNNVWASYTHIFAEACPLWAKNFVSLAEVRHLQQGR